MLHRSFKPAKCKTSLKLAASRIKLMKNKKQAQLKVLKREVAELLASEKDQTARIRVEHVVREEKTLTAYELLEIYCELIVARLPIIETQKTCPIDLKEAITSVIFASPRCSDIPELMDVRKHFTAKYGKEFINAAVELRPECGVSRMLVEKLSAKAPDGPTKVKILSAIAEEHNIKWDPKSFGEKDSKYAEDLLNGPSNFDKPSKMAVDPPNFQAPPSRNDSGSSYVQVPPKSNEKYDAPVNFHEHNARPSPRSQTDIDKAGAFHPEQRPTGSGNERMGFRHSYSGDRNTFSSGSQNWNMDFKDANAAAQAAAVSAERASMAARAAAELASHGNTSWQYSTESQSEEPKRSADSTLQSDHHAKGPINNALNGGSSARHHEQTDRHQPDGATGIAEKFHRDSFKSTNKSSRSLNSSSASIDGKPLVDDLQMADRHSRKNSFELEQSSRLGQISLKKQSSRSEVEFVNKLQDGHDSERIDDFEEARIRNQSSRASSRSHSSTFNDDHSVIPNLNCQNSGECADENPFSVNSNGTVRRNSNEIKSHENAAMVFDDSGSDSEHKIDEGLDQKGPEYDFDLYSLSRRTPAHMFADSSSPGDRQNNDDLRGKSFAQSHFSAEHLSGPVFSESSISSTVPSHSDVTLPVTFDDSEGPSSESEVELDKSKHVSSTDVSKHNVYSRTLKVTQDESHSFMDSSFAEKGNVRSSKPLSRPPSFDANPAEVQSDKDQGIRVNNESVRKFGYGDEGKHQQIQQPSGFSMGHVVKDDVLTPPRAEAMEDTGSSKVSSLETGLSLGNLTGGFRNKGYRHPPYMLSPSGNASLSKQTADDTNAKIEESPSATVKASASPGATSQDPYNRKVSAEAYKRPNTRAHFSPHVDDSDDDSDDELPRQIYTRSQEPYNKKAGIGENKISSSRTQVKHLDPFYSDSEDDVPTQALTSKTHSNSSFSRRTKPSPSNTEKSYYLKPTSLSEASGTPDYSEERNSSSRSSYGTETGPKPQSQNRTSGRLESSEQSRMAEQAGYKPVSEPKRSSFGEQPSNSFPKEVASGNTKNLKTSSSSVETSAAEKASHVHPKLPDYELLTAHLQSLRVNRK